METYYISFEAQGYDIGTIKVEANNELEAKGKALEVFAGCMVEISYNVYVDTKKPECAEVYLDEDGEEIKSEEEE